MRCATARAQVLVGVAAAALVLAGCTDDGSDSPTPAPTESPTPAPTASAAPSSGDWSAPGLVDRAGSPVEVPVPEPATGESLDVTDFGADPEPDSGDDAAAIRDAIAAAEEGDEVVLPAGTYDLRSTDEDDEDANIVLRSGVDLRGAGADETILRTSFDGEDDSRVVRGRAVEDVIVADLTITSTYDGPLGEDPDDDDAGGGPMFGIHLGARDGQGSARVLIDGVHVERFQRHGISLKSSREVTITGCRLADATSVGAGGSGYGIAVEGQADERLYDEDDDSRHNVVVDNTFDGEHLRHAILLQFPTHNNLVADNEIDGSILDAIDLHGEGEYLNEVRGNTVRDGERAGIALGNSGGENNKHDATGPGNWVHENVLEGNRQGILVILGTPDTLVENNDITGGDGAEVGIELRNAPGTVVRGNTITDADAEDFWAIRLTEDDGADGRGVGVPEDVRIVGNTIIDSANGIRVDAGEEIEMGENVLRRIDGTEVRVADRAEVSGPDA
ncbi:right-handed parallel beta-helix repeat-containing protein [Georgenia subflava]|uniref:Right handed beta helix domain-containing protein n=1 Tax=Georgenia subflava TaxID=1622177 RepID=A0A6N7ELB9_9MICO|nr:right-handed parallel beta-helix repeat-containing protein [Georgenia subflava]MPV36054.1 hypothetical protein [Georgenia subflava]